MKDLFHNVKVARALSPVSVSDNTAQVCQVVDGANAETVLYVIQTGSIADADATFTTLLEESDASGSGFAAVADEDMHGTESGASFIFSDDNEQFKLAYKGQKRYTRLTITPANNASAAVLAVTAILAGIRVGGQTTQGT